MTSSHDATLKRLEDELAALDSSDCELTLFVSGASDLAARAIANARKLCDTHLHGRGNLSVVDVHEDPAAVLSSRLPRLRHWSGTSRCPCGGPLATRPTPTRCSGRWTSHPSCTRRHHTDRHHMARQRPTLRSESPVEPASDRAEWAHTIVEIVNSSDGTDHDSTSRSDALIRMAEAEDTLRAIAAGEVDALVVSDGGSDRRVFTLSTAHRPYRMFVENMRDGAATVSSGGVILYANRRLAELLSSPRESIVGSRLVKFVAGGLPIGLDEIIGTDGLGTTAEFDLLDSDGAVVPVLVGNPPLAVDGDDLICLTFTDLSTARSAGPRDRSAQPRPGRADGRPAGRPSGTDHAGDARRADRIAEAQAARRSCR